MNDTRRLTLRAKVILGSAVFFGLIALTLFGVHTLFKLRLQRYKTELMAKGEALSVQQLVPKLAPREDDGTPLMRLPLWRMPGGGPVLTKNPPRTMRQIAPGRALIGWQQPEIRGSDRTTNSWDELGQELEDMYQAMDQIRAALRKPVFDFALNYSEGFTVRLPHLAKIKQSTLTFSAGTLYELHEGRLAPAFTNLVAAVATTRLLQNERLIISQLVRIAMAHIAASTTWEALQAPGWIDEQLAQWQGQWQSLGFIGAMERSFEMERAMGVETISRMRRFSSEYQKLSQAFGFGGPSTPAVSNSGDLPALFKEIGENSLRSVVTIPLEYLYRWIFSYEDERRHLQFLQIVIEGLRFAGTNHSYLAARVGVEARFKELGFERIQINDDGFRMDAEGVPFPYIFSSFTRSIEKTDRKAITAETARELVVAAIALKRFQLRHNRYPDKLSALVPEFLSVVPADFIDGRPLRYRLDAGGTFTLYSIGYDGKDDGGDPRPPEGSKSRDWLQGRDWVWPQPATPEEIKAAEEAESKRH